MHIKITDFGTSTEINEISDSFVGTAQYLSPEAIDGKQCKKKEIQIKRFTRVKILFEFNSRSDLWALGCIIFQFLTNKHAFDAKSEYLILKKIQEGKIEFPDDFPFVAKDLVLKLTVNTNPF
jgi:3-phosphoinositide dependent protein kinase-1